MTARMLTFKHEDEVMGEPVGPAIVSNLDDPSGEIEDLGWMTLSQARELARARDWEFDED
jgi:hypothetical protein